MNERMRRGFFKIAGEMIRSDDFDVLKSVMNDVVVFHVDSNFFSDEITYYAYHPSFDEADHRCVAPEYEPIVHSSSDNRIRVEWRRK